MFKKNKEKIKKKIHVRQVEEEFLRPLSFLLNFSPRQWHKSMNEAVRVNLTSYMNKPKCTLLFRNLPLISPVWFRIPWLVHFSFCLLTCWIVGFLWFLILGLKTHLQESSSAWARQVLRTDEFASKLLHIRKSRKQRDRCWPPIRHKKTKLKTSIQITRGTGLLRVASQGLSCPF